MLVQEKKKEAPSGTRSVVRAMEILNSFLMVDQHLTLTDVAIHSGLDKATARRFLLTFVELGYVDYDERTKRYCLGLKVLELAAALPIRNFREAAYPLMARLAEKAKATCFLSVIRGNQALCVDRVHDPQQLVQVRHFSVGQFLPLHCGAAPRLLLAHLPEDRREQILAGDLQAMTPYTITDRKRLRAICDDIVRRGWEVCVDDAVVGISAVAVPIRNKSQQVVAALSLGGLSNDILSGGEPRHLSLLMKCAEEITAIGAYTGG